MTPKTTIATCFVTIVLALTAGSGRVSAQDCNNNGIPDPCDIDCGASGGPCDLPGCGASSDCNANGVPDECEIPGVDMLFYGAGNGPESVAVGDLNGDGHPDLAVANRHSDDVSVLLNNGDGTFADDELYSVGDGPRSLAMGDLDGDGDLDLAVANYGSNDVSVLLNNGNGIFPVVGAPSYATGATSPRSVAVGDLDGDGHLDLAVANIASDTVSTLLNNGDGTFPLIASHWLVGDGPASVAMGDLDCDGDLDLVVANFHDDNVSLLLNNGNGTFANDLLYDAGDGPFSVALGDLDCDGQPDLAVANRFANSVSVLLNTGPFILAPQVTYGAGAMPWSVAVSDLDGDGHADLAVANVNGNDVSFLKNNGDGTFADDVLFGAGSSPRAVAAGDLDGDGLLDLAVANVNGANVSVLLHGHGDCNGNDVPDECDIAGGTSADCNTNGVPDECEVPWAETLFAPDVLYVGCEWSGYFDSPTSIVAGDLDCDGDLELAVANDILGNVGVLVNHLGNGTFLPDLHYDAGHRSVSVAAGDLNGDGYLDLAVTNTLSGDVSVLLNSGGGTFPVVGAPAYVTGIAGPNPRSVAVGDLNGDDYPDLAVANSGSDDVAVLLNNGNGTFPFPAAPPTYATGGTSPWSVAVGDLNGDGHLDLAVANRASNNVSVLLNDGLANFPVGPPFMLYGTGTSPWSVAMGDLDGDGDLDLAVANSGSNNVSVLLNDGLGIFGMAFYDVGSEPRSVAMGDLDGDGDLDLAVANKSSDDVSILLNDGNGAFPVEVRFGTGCGPSSVAVGDLDGDGDLDLAVANLTGDTVSVLLHVDGDCNGNGVPDECDISSGDSSDSNGNGVPDECEPGICGTCKGDMNGDNKVNGKDVSLFMSCLLSGNPSCPCADMDDSGTLDSTDVDMLVSDLLSGASCP